jgi:hypothetical protein
VRDIRPPPGRSLRRFAFEHGNRVQDSNGVAGLAFRAPAENRSPSSEHVPRPGENAEDPARASRARSLRERQLEPDPLLANPGGASPGGMAMMRMRRAPKLTSSVLASGLSSSLLGARVDYIGSDIEPDPLPIKRERCRELLLRPGGRCRRRLRADVQNLLDIKGIILDFKGSALDPLRLPSREVLHRQALRRLSSPGRLRCPFGRHTVSFHQISLLMIIPRRRLLPLWLYLSERWSRARSGGRRA